MGINELYIVLMSIIIIIAPIIPDSILMLFDNVIIRIASVLFALYIVNKGPIAAIFGFITIAIIFLERNKRKVRWAAIKLDKMDTNIEPQMSVEESGISQKTVPVVEFDRPEYNELSYMPKHDSGSNEFNPVDVSINNKQVLQTIYQSGPADKSAIFKSLGFA